MFSSLNPEHKFFEVEDVDTVHNDLAASAITEFALRLNEC